MNYILRIWKGDASGTPAHTQVIHGGTTEIGKLAERRVRALGFDPDKDDYTLAEHEVSKTTKRHLSVDQARDFQ